MSFDFSTLMEAAGNDEDLVRTLIKIFQEECPQMLDNIERAIENSEPKQLHEAAHKLKGTLGNMGANAAMDQTVALEAMGINEEMQQADVGLERLKNQIEILLQDLNTYEGTATE